MKMKLKKKTKESVTSSSLSDIGVKTGTLHHDFSRESEERKMRENVRKWCEK